MALKESVRFANKAHTICEVMVTGGGIMEHHIHYLQAWQGSMTNTIHKVRSPRREVHWVGQNRGFDPEKEAQVAPTVAKFFREVEAKLAPLPEDTAGWVFVDQYVWCLVRKGHAKSKQAIPVGQHPGCCMRHISHDFTSAYCLRPPVDGLDCKMHKAHVDRHLARQAEKAESSRLRREEMDRDRQAREYTRELWDMACDLMDIDPERRGDLRGGTDTTTTDTEILQTMLRRIIDTA